MAQRALDGARLPGRVQIRNLLVLGAILLASWAAVQSPLFHRVAPPGLQLRDLRSVTKFQTMFNADAGMPRLVLIFSPT
jgi:hypothetical protein